MHHINYLIFKEIFHGTPQISEKSLHSARLMRERPSHALLVRCASSFMVARPVDVRWLLECVPRGSKASRWQDIRHCRTDRPLAWNVLKATAYADFWDSGLEEREGQGSRLKLGRFKPVLDFAACSPILAPCSTSSPGAVRSTPRKLGQQQSPWGPERGGI